MRECTVCGKEFEDFADTGQCSVECNQLAIEAIEDDRAYMAYMAKYED